MHFSLLKHADWKLLWIPVSIVSTSFGFHIIIPTLTDYLHRDVRQIRLVLFLGSLFPLIVYITWEFVTLGIIPLQGEHGLIQGYQKGMDGGTLLASLLQDSHLALLARLFSLFAIVTSFLGVSLSLRDFLSDGLKIRKTPKGRMILYVLSFIPPLIIVLIDPRAFLRCPRICRSIWSGDIARCNARFDGVERALYPGPNRPFPRSRRQRGIGSGAFNLPLCDWIRDSH